MRYSVNSIYTLVNCRPNEYGTCSTLAAAVELYLAVKEMAITTGWQVLVLDNYTGEILIEGKVRE